MHSESLSRVSLSCGGHNNRSLDVVAVTKLRDVFPRESVAGAQVVLTPEWINIYYFDRLPRLIDFMPRMSYNHLIQNMVTTLRISGLTSSMGDILS